MGQALKFCRDCENKRGCDTCQDLHEWIMERLDAVPVVRCRECKHWQPSGSKAGKSFSDMEYIGGCEFTKYCRRESDFCSYGERKDGGEKCED